MIVKSNLQIQMDQLIVSDLAEKLQDPQKVKETVLENRNKNPSLKYFPWSDFSLSHGYPALVVFYAHLDRYFPQQRWDFIAHEYIVKIIGSIESHGIDDFSLFSGLAGICFAVLRASKDKTRYQDLLQTLNVALVEGTQNKFLLPIGEDIENKIPSSIQLYDLIQGITGIGSYFIQDLQNSQLYDPLLSIVHTLIQRCNPIQVDRTEVPGWYVPVHFQFTEQDKILFPNGNFNLGLAHGVSGILAFLSLAYSKGIRLDNQMKTIRQIANWLISKNTYKNKAPIWPDRISLECEVLKISAVDPILRDAWCYGTPGVARSLYLAGHVLNDNNLKNYAVEAFKKIFHRSEHEWWLPGPTFCHGILGLLAMTNRMAQDTRDPFLFAQTERLKQKLMNYYNPSLPFGFQDLEPLTFQKGASNLSYIGINKAGLLEGAAGIGLGLLGLSQKDSLWDAPFLMGEIHD